MTNNPKMQTKTLQAALHLLVTATDPRTRVDLDVAWPEDRRSAYKAWQPSEPSPIVAHNMDMIRKARRESK